MSIVEDLNEHPVRGNKEVFVKHGEFSYLVKNYASDSADNDDTSDENREWNIIVYPDGFEPSLLEKSSRKMKVETNDDSYFQLMLGNGADENVVCVRSQTTKHRPCIKIAMNQRECAGSDKSVKISSSVKQGLPQKASEATSFVTFFTPCTSLVKNWPPIPFLTLLACLVSITCAVLLIPSSFLKCVEKPSLKLTSNLKNSNNPVADLMFVESVMHLYSIAAQHGLTEMQENSISLLKDFTESKNLLQIIETAHKLEDFQIKDFVLKLLPENKTALYQSPEWSKISKNFPTLASEIENGNKQTDSLNSLPEHKDNVDSKLDQAIINDELKSKEHQVGGGLASRLNNIFYNEV